MEGTFQTIAAVVACSSLLAWLACRGRQPIILGYFFCGIILGPELLGIIPEAGSLHEMSRLGVALLLFLAGLVLHPDRLRKFFKVAITVALATAVMAWTVVYAVLRLLGESNIESIIAGSALMFSSTILVVKLLPTTTLHQRRMGSICIAVLIAEDLLAVVILLLAGVSGGGERILILLLPVKVIVLFALAVIGEQFVLRKMMRSTDRYGEVLVMLCLGWCVGLALLSERVGVPYEVGAFAAGVAMARGKIAYVLAEQLKPIRDFFLMFFFFALGAAFDVAHLSDIWKPAVLLAVLLCTVTPVWLNFVLQKLGEEKDFARETAVRLGQVSEFALIIAVAFASTEYLSGRVAQMIQLTTVLSMLISSYVVVFKYPTPIGVQPSLQRD